MLQGEQAMPNMSDFFARISRLPVATPVRDIGSRILGRTGVFPRPLPTTPSPIFYVSNTKYGLDDTGRYWLRGNDHKRIILKGINLPLIDDWDFPAKSPYGRLEDLARSGANCVRIQWYATPPSAQRPPYSTADLDRVLERCRTLRLVPIVELHDLTCKPDPNLLNSQLVPWWTRPDVVKVLRRHERYLIVNLANELGQYRWANWSPDALTTFKNAYGSAARIGDI